MSWKEQEILDKIKEKTDPIETPDSLRPETVRQRLAGRKSRNARRWMKATLPAAACLVLAAGIYIYVNRGTLEETIVRDWAPESLTEEISQSKTIASAESYQQIYEYLEEAREKQEIVGREQWKSPRIWARTVWKAAHPAVCRAVLLAARLTALPGRLLRMRESIPKQTCATRAWMKETS